MIWVLRLLAGEGVAARGEYDQRDASRVRIRFERGKYFQAIHARHDDVEDCGRGLLRPDGSERGISCGAGGPGVTCLAQRHFEQVQHVRGIFSNDKVGHVGWWVMVFNRSR